MLVADTTVRIAERFVELLGFKKFITFHIRRGDAKRHCDTGLTNVWKYLKCSLEPEKTMLPIVLFTDEHDRNYLRNMKSYVEQLGREFVLGDTIVRRVMKEMVFNGDLDDRYLNNYSVFAVVRYIQENLSKYRLTMRRSFHCVECDAEIFL